MSTERSLEARLGGMGTLLVITGPPGAGKSTVARMIADAAKRSVLVEGDSFFGFLASGAIEPWLPHSHEQNEVVTPGRRVGRWTLCPWRLHHGLRRRRRSVVPSDLRRSHRP